MKLFYTLILFTLINNIALPVQAKELVFEKRVLSIDGHKLSAEIAESEQQRQFGLMHRKALAKDSGMLFVFDSSNNVCFWMKDTLIPLSIAFINERGVITQIEDMQPEDTKYVCAKDKISYALEVNQGWFTRNKIEKGMSIEGINHSIP